MSATRMSRAVPGVRRILCFNKQVGNRPVTVIVMRPTSVRHIYRGSFGRDNPFTQMEEFMKDMEKKFKRDVDGIFRELPRFMESGRPQIKDVKPRPRFGEMEDISTPDTYRLAFHFPNANPENVKVSLKGQTLTVSGSAEEITENSRSSSSYSVEYEVHEDINLDALESSISNDGVLTIEAPKAVPEVEAPRTVQIERE